MLDRRPVLCVVAGPNGSGKTSATIQLLSNEWAADALYINPDNIAQETFGDWNSPTAILKAAQVATEERYRCLAEKKDFVFETVLSSEEKLQFLKKAHESGFFIRLFLYVQILRRLMLCVSQSVCLMVVMRSDNKNNLSLL